jgi:hypothetical protein
VSRRRSPRPPRKLCTECGGHFYGWGAFCSTPACVAARTAPAESWRGFRQRVIEGK